MSDAVLTAEQAHKLLQELSANDGFRQRFEDKPAAALIELGIPHEVVVNLNAACLAPVKLASKQLFTQAAADIASNSANSCLQMIPPKLKV